MTHKVFLKFQEDNYLCQKQSMFLRDPRSDIFVLTQDLILPVHSEQMRNIPFFQKNFRPQQRIYILTEEFPGDNLVKILSFYYGYSLEFQNAQQIISMRNLLDFFNIEEIKEKLCEEIEKNFDELNLFSVLQIAQEYKFEDLECRCWNSLEDYDFEHVNFQITGLLDCKQLLFEQVVSRLSYYHEKKYGKKSESKQIRLVDSIINYYCQTNQIYIEQQEQENLSSFLTHSMEFEAKKNSRKQKYYSLDHSKIDTANLLSLPKIKRMNNSTQANSNSMLGASGREQDTFNKSCNQQKESTACRSRSNTQNMLKVPKINKHFWEAVEEQSL